MLKMRNETESKPAGNILLFPFDFLLPIHSSHPGEAHTKKSSMRFNLSYMGDSLTTLTFAI